MSQLFFKKPYQDAIRAGTKQTTLRRWSRPMVQPGRRAFSPGLGWLAIEAVDAVRLEDLGDDDANADGFKNFAEMKRQLFKLYPDHKTDEKQWFRVRFSYAAPQARRKPSPTLF
jgi:hypothetical protein